MIAHMSKINNTKTHHVVGHEINTVKKGSIALNRLACISTFIEVFSLPSCQIEAVLPTLSLSDGHQFLNLI